jgi:oligosaccharide amylase
MAKSLVLGNGEMLVGLDQQGQVQDLYFPYVGLENHVSRYFLHRLGVKADDSFSWLSEGGWSVQVSCHENTFAGHTRAVHEGLGVALEFTDVVYNEKNILVRRVMVRNLQDRKRTIKIFFGHEFQISESWRGDTGYYDPRCSAIVHYKGKRAFLINAQHDNKPFDDYSVGIFKIEGREGSFRDAEDGVLSKNPIEHGAVDSVVGVTLELAGSTEGMVHYWLAMGTSIEDVHELNTYVLNKGPEHLIETTSNYWHAWVNKKKFTFYGLDEEVVKLFHKSLFVIRAHADNRGAIIASGDSDILHHGRGTYAYVWPRDGARAAMAMVRAGDTLVAQRFFEFCNQAITKEGYFMHKYRPDGSLGSSWHPWVREGKMELPIQEDETALVVGALWKYYEVSRDIEFIERVYNSLIARAANFLMHYVYPDSGLPYPSYDVWEEKYGISTFTCGAKYDSLMAAARFAELLGKDEDAETYRTTAERVKTAILEHLYNKERKMFYKLLTVRSDGTLNYDATLDASSIFGIFSFHVLPVTDPRVQESIATLEEKLEHHFGIGGMPRYEGDQYFAAEGGSVSNPWIIPTLWLAQYYIDIAEKEADMERVHNYFKWVVEHTPVSGMLSEQLHPYTGDQIGATPLVWSHSEFVVSVVKYLEKLEKLGIARVTDLVE